MRTGADYRRALRDGRKVWVMGEGRVDDVTTHPATRAMVEEYALWYDRHCDPAWREILLSPYESDGGRTPWAYVAPTKMEDLVGMGRSFSKTLFLNGGNVTHTPAYGNLIALGVLTAVQAKNLSPEHEAAAIAYRDMIARTGRFLTFCGGAPIIGQRMRRDPAERVALTLVRETDAGVVLRGRLGMHTSPAFAEDVYVGHLCGVDIGGQRASFIVPVAAAGVTVLCRKRAARSENPFMAPLSSRFDELDGQMWLDDVFLPWERVFFVDPTPEAIPRWLRWHHLYGWLAKAEFTLGLALAVTQAMGLAENQQTIEYLIDLVAAVQTVRSCLVAAECQPDFTAAGFCFPDHAHLAAGGIALFQARQRVSEILRIVPGLLAGRRPVRCRSRRPRARLRPRRCFRGRRLYRLAARGIAAARRRSCLLGARRPRIRVRAARQRRHDKLAPLAAPQLPRLQRSGQCRAGRARPADAGDRPWPYPHRPDRRPPHRPAGRQSTTRLIARPRRMLRRFPYPSRR